MNIPALDPAWRIERIEWARLTGERPREAGCNARLGVHGKQTRTDLVRITAGGVTGFGWAALGMERAREIAGTPVCKMFGPDGLIAQPYRAIEFPLLDWLGRIAQRSVYALVAGAGGTEQRALEVPCYDTSLYIDDLQCTDDEAAAALLQSEAREGWEKGHRAFKIKIGRGARHMPLQEGMRRDVAVVRAVRAAVGADARLMLDANNGLNLNLTKVLLEETAEQAITWMEEPFHEDPVLYEDLKGWLAQKGLSVLIADGEGEAAAGLVGWAKRGLVDVLQYDVRRPGFTFWLQLARELAGSPVKAAPHSYGGPYGNYASCHLAPAVENFLFVEWDEVAVPGLDAPGYSIVEGKVSVPPTPGFGLELDERYYAQQVESEGWRVDA
ncbi:MAG TPA: enolase C-terminal domain-like protein [Limnochordia bacterium]